MLMLFFCHRHLPFARVCFWHTMCTFVGILLSINQKGHIANADTPFKVKLIPQLTQTLTSCASDRKQDIKQLEMSVKTNEWTAVLLLDSKNRCENVVPAIDFWYCVDGRKTIQFHLCVRRAKLIHYEHFCLSSRESTTCRKKTHTDLCGHSNLFAGQLFGAREWHAVKVIQNQRWTVPITHARIAVQWRKQRKTPNAHIAIHKEEEEQNDEINWKYALLSLDIKSKRMKLAAFKLRSISCVEWTDFVHR